MKTPEAAARYILEQASEHSPASRPDMEGWERFARAAEAAGIESVLISFSRHEPDPMLVSCALGQRVDRLRFIVAYRSGLISPASFVQQLNTLSTLVAGRIALNMVAGSSRAEQYAYGDFVEHDRRYARTDEFLEVCQAFWRDRNAKVNFDGKFYRVQQGQFPTPFLASDRSGPEIYVSGHSEQAERLVLSRGGCWLRGADTPEKLEPIVARCKAVGVEVGLRLCVLCRPTKQEAVDAAEALVPHCERGMWGEGRESRDDSTMYRQSMALTDRWLSPSLWTGLVPRCGGVWTTLLGSPEEIAGALLAYKRIGITQFIMSGWPEIEEVARFGREVLPLVRTGELRQNAVENTSADMLTR
jgi:alkanesulfonate monooxygenase